MTFRQGYTVFSIPVGVVYRPNEAKVRNLKSKDYLGKARLVAASDRANAFTGFAGSEIKNVSEFIYFIASCSTQLTKHRTKRLARQMLRMTDQLRRSLSPLPI